jgi:hypothetical protein
MAPIVPRPELDKAEKLVTLTLTKPLGPWTAGTSVSYWRAPNRGGGTCWLIGPAPLDRRSGGSMCGRDDGGGPDRPTVAVGGGLASGFVRDGSRIVRITINGADVDIAHGAFLAEVGDGPWRIVGYDSAGNEVSSVKLPG